MRESLGETKNLTVLEQVIFGKDNRFDLVSLLIGTKGSKWTEGNC